MKHTLKFWYGLIGIAFLFFSTSTDNPEVIYWTPEYRLTWDDFQGNPNFSHKNISAITSSGIVHYKGCDDGLIKYKIRSYFEKDHSWVKNEARTPHHLSHEQIHFDITELYARKLRKALKKRQFVCGQEVEFDNFVFAFSQSWQNEQQNYDLLSRHSLEKKQQREWFYRIAMELSLLDDYASGSEAESEFEDVE